MPSFNLPTRPGPGTPSNIYSAQGISDAELVNIGGEIRRGSGGYGRTIAGSSRLGRFYGLKSEEEMSNILSRRGIDTGIPTTESATTYSPELQNLLNWKAGIEQQQAAEAKAAKKRQGFIQSNKLMEVLGTEGYYKNLAAQTTNPTLKKQYEAIAAQAAGRAQSQAQSDWNYRQAQIATFTATQGQSIDPNTLTAGELAKAMGFVKSSSGSSSSSKTSTPTPTNVVSNITGNVSSGGGGGGARGITGSTTTTINKITGSSTISVPTPKNTVSSVLTKTFAPTQSVAQQRRDTVSNKVNNVVSKISSIFKKR